MANSEYNPDVLNCIANLSNDEVFTPPVLANQVLDMLPQELFRSPDTKFLDPFCKSGVFLREIVKRLDMGLADQIPNRQERIDHIMHHQVYGMALTELTALLSRRPLYCSKAANSLIALAILTMSRVTCSTKPFPTHGSRANASIVVPAKRSMTEAANQSNMLTNLFIQTIPNSYSLKI